MKINLKGTNISITEAISNYLDKRLEGVAKFLPEEGRACTVDVELGKTTEHHHSGDIFRAEINVHVAGKSFRAVSEQSDLYHAIDEMKAEITREMGSFKAKRLSLLRRGGQKVKNLLRHFYK